MTVSDEIEQLEKNLLEWGCREKLVVWTGHNTLLDGHNRYGICQKHNIEFEVEKIELEDRDDALDWIIKNQLGRRNLTSEQISYLRGKQYQREKKAANRPTRGEERGDNLPVLPERTREKLATEHKVSDFTIKEDAKFAQAVDTIAEATDTTARTDLLSRDTKVTKKDTVKLGAIAKANPQSAKNVLAQVKQASNTHYIKTTAIVRLGMSIFTCGFQRSMP